MHLLLSTPRVTAIFRKTVFWGAAAGLLLTGGCGKAPEPSAETSAEPTTQPASTPTNSKPSAVVQPPGKEAPERIVYVAAAFQAMNSDGTHDVPAGAAVKVLAEEGDEYVIEYEGISVRTPKGFFSETKIEEVAAPTPEPVAAAPTPDMIPLPEATPALPEPAPAQPEPAQPETLAEGATEPTPAGTPDPAMAADEEKATELIGEIRAVNDEIRAATDKLETAPAPEKAKEAARIEKLKKRRDTLSEDLTRVAKP
jgi:hypothetical protein